MNSCFKSEDGQHKLARNEVATYCRLCYVVPLLILDDIGEPKIAVRKVKQRPGVVHLPSLQSWKCRQTDPNAETPPRRVLAYERDKGMCRYCGVVLTEVGPHRFSIDHVIPRAKGGSNELDNIVSACYTCNHRKGEGTLAQCGMVLLPVP